MERTTGFTFDDVLLVPSYNGIRSRKDVNTQAKLRNWIFEVPIVTANMDTVTGWRMANAIADFGGLGILHRFLSIEENVAEFKKVKFPEKVGVSIGIGSHALERAEALVSAGAQIVCVDVAHGHSKLVNQTIRELRGQYGENICILAGNVATYAGADYLAAAGADAVKVGIGPGSVCTTRIKTGFGVPQLSAIMECARVDRPIIADGGIRTPGDAVKALAAGALMVMLGGMLAGTEETPGEPVEKRNSNGETKKFKRFRGMASKEAQEDFMGAMADWKTAEGVSMDVPMKGPALDVFKDIIGGIRSGLTYCGAKEIRDLQRKARFIEITPSGMRESRPHALES